MAKQSIGKTGPRSVRGKKNVAKNAQKFAIFSPGYLACEDLTLKQAQFAALCRQWGGDDPTQQLILRTIEQASLGLERMMRAEKAMLEGVMQSLDIAQRFALQAGLNPVKALHFPAWFFSEDDWGQKEYAMQLDRVWREAALLKECFSDREVSHIALRYPNLHQFVMEGTAPNTSFVMRLGERYAQTTVTLNLAALMNQLREKYEFHLLWAIAPVRHQCIIDAIRAAQSREVMDLEKSNRYATNFQNRILKGFQALALLNQYEVHAPHKTTFAIAARPVDPDSQPE